MTTLYSSETATQIVDEWLRSSFGGKFATTRGYIQQHRTLLEALIAVRLDQAFRSGTDTALGR
jgi:hypothetical protein